MKGVYGYDIRNGGYEGNRDYYLKNGYSYSYRYSDKQVYVLAAISLLIIFFAAKWLDKIMLNRKKATNIQEINVK